MNGNDHINNQTIDQLEMRIGRTQTDIELLKQQVGSLQQGVSSLTTSFQNFLESFQESRKPNWSLWLAVIGVLFAVCSGGWLVLTLKINAETFPMNQRLTQIETVVGATHTEVSGFRDKIANIISQNQTSIEDRVHINSDISVLRERQATIAANLASEVATRMANEREIETQFDAMSQLLATQFAEQQRCNAVIWNSHQDKLGQYPTGPYFFPNVSKRESRANNGGTR